MSGGAGGGEGGVLEKCDIIRDAAETLCYDRVSCPSDTNENVWNHRRTRISPEEEKVKRRPVSECRQPRR